MNLALQIGDSQIPCEQVLQQLAESKLLSQLLRDMVIDELIDRVAREYGIDLTPTPAAVDRLTQRIAAIRPFQGMNAEQIAAITARTLKLNQFKQAGWGHKVSSYYHTVQHQLDRVSYSILQVEDGLIAQELFFRIQSDEASFAELAIQYSQDGAAARGGTIGPLLMKEVHPTLGQILRQLQPGELSPLFQIDRNYGFIRLNELTPAQLDEDTHQLLMDELFEQWIQPQLAAEIGENAQISLGPVIAPSNSDAPQLLPVSAKIADTAPPHGQTTINPFAPDFATRETIFTADPQSESLVTISPEVTVVNEPVDPDLDVTTGFFFPDRQQDQSTPAPTVTIPATDSNPQPAAVTFTPDTISDPLRQTQQRSRQLAIAIALLSTIILAAVGIDRYYSAPQPHPTQQENRE